MTMRCRLCLPLSFTLCILRSSGFQHFQSSQQPRTLRAYSKRENSAQKAWERKTLGFLDVDETLLEDDRTKRVREAKIAWAHIHSARRAIGDGLEAKARAAYNYYLKRFRDHSAVLVTDVFLRLAIFEHNLGNTKEARRAFRLGARTVHEALKANSIESKFLRERGATLYCSWGLHEYRFAGVRTNEERVKRSRGYLLYAARMDASKSPVLSWSRFQERSSTRLYASVRDDVDLLKNHVPTWKIKQIERYRSLVANLLVSASQGNVVEIESAVKDFERRAGKRAPARSPKLVGKWRLAYAAPRKCCACGKQPLAVKGKLEPTMSSDTISDIMLFGSSEPKSNNDLLELNHEFRCEVDGSSATFRPVADDILEFVGVGPVLEGHATVTYLDDRLMILRRSGCGYPVAIFERPEL